MDISSAAALSVCTSVFHMDCGAGFLDIHRRSTGCSLGPACVLGSCSWGRSGATLDICLELWCLVRRCTEFGVAVVYVCVGYSRAIDEVFNVIKWRL